MARGYLTMTLIRLMAGASLGVIVLANVACEQSHTAPTTVEDLMDDRITLDSVLLKCNESPAMAHTSRDCLNARIAIERLATDVDPKEEAKRSEEFEQSRERLRLAQERAKRDRDARATVDAYSLPMVPVEPATVAGTPAPKP